MKKYKKIGLRKISFFVILSILFFNIFLVSPISAILTKSSIISEPYFEQGTDITIRVPCTYNGTTCPNTTSCYCNILDPNQNILLNNYAMVRNGSYFEANLTASQTEINGEYELNVYCSDGSGNPISRFLYFFVTPSGVPQTTGRSIFYIGLFLLLIIFFILTIVGIIKTNSLLPRFSLFLASYLLMVAITFVAWNMSVSFLENAPFLIAFFRILFFVFLIGMIPIVFGSVIWVGYMALTIKEMKNLMERGIPEDESWARVRGKRW